MHKRIIASIVARIVVFVSLTMFFPLAWALYDHANSLETVAFIATMLIGLILSGLAQHLFPLHKDDYKKLVPKDGLAIVGVSWICLSALGALPLYFSNVVPTFTDAFFEIASGFTTTGATIFTDIEALPRGILFWRSFTQWLGGMGIIVLYIAFLPALGQKASQLYKAEAPGISVEKVDPRLKETAKNLWFIYLFFTFLEVILLHLGGLSWFDSLCHTFATVASGGFSTKNASIAAFSPYIQWVIIAFMFLTGINYLLHYQALRGKVLIFFKREEFRYYLLIILLLVPAFAAILNILSLSESPVRDAAFQVIAILTSTGFVTADFNLWPYAMQITLVILMFMGGCGGSTSGGMKISRFFVAIKASFRSIMKNIYPNVVIPIKMDHKPLSDGLIASVVAYFSIYMFLFLAGSVLITITEGCDLVTALTATISALSNIGPGLGQVGPMENYGWISIPGKWLLTFLMLAGRLELYAILILLLPETWRK